jgi:DNA transformation protein
VRPSSFVEHVLDLLSPLGPVRSRAMMGGTTVFAGDLSVGIVVSDRLYLKVDAETREAFAGAGGEAFAYERDGKLVAMSYWTPPDDALEGPDAMRPWAELALAAAARARRPGRSRARGVERSGAPGRNAGTPPRRRR